MTNSSVRASLVLILTFAAGGAAGVAADRIWLDAEDRTARAAEASSDSARAEEDRRDEHGEDRPRTTIEKFADELKLTREQRARIEEILSRHREAMHEMWKEIRPRFRTLVDSARADIEAVLTPEQVEQYRKYLRREHEEFDEQDGPDPDAADRRPSPGDTAGGG